MISHDCCHWSVLTLYQFTHSLTCSLSNMISNLWLIIPHFKEVERAVYWFHIVCPSVRLSIHLWIKTGPICIFHNTSQIHFMFAHLIKQFQKMCVNVIAKVQNLTLLQMFEICNFDFVLLWHGIWNHSVGNHLGGGVYSQNTGILVFLVFAVKFHNAVNFFQSMHFSRYIDQPWTWSMIFFVSWIFIIYLTILWAVCNLLLYKAITIPKICYGYLYMKLMLVSDFGLWLPCHVQSYMASIQHVIAAAAVVMRILL